MINVELLVEALANADWLLRDELIYGTRFVQVGDCDGLNVFDEDDLKSLCDEINKRLIK